MDKQENTSPWLEWAIELQFIGQAGVTYSQDPFDLERFKRIREIAAEMLSCQSGFPLEKVKSIFCNETGFQTPKLDTRAAIFSNGALLLVQERDDRWALPGGWVDINESIRSNTVKEVREESGLEVEPVRLIALHDRNKHNVPVYAYGVCKVFVLCELRGGSFVPNHETQGSAWFRPADQLPPLAEEKNSREQIEMCFAAAETSGWQPLFD